MIGSFARAAIIGIIAVCAGISEPDQQISEASSSVGTLSSLNHWKKSAQILNLDPGTTIVELFEVTGHANNQCIWGCGDATHGWFLVHGSSNNLVLFFRGAGGGSWTISSNLYLGIHCLALTRKLDGSVWYSLDGGPDTQLVAAPTYTSVVSGDQFVGYDTGEANFAATNSRVLALAVYNSELSGTTRQQFSDSVNLLNRYRLRDECRTNSNLVSEIHFDRDWNGSAASVTGGLGSSPHTLDKVGTGGGKVAIEAEIRYRIQQEWVHDNGYWVSLAIGIRRHSQGARTLFRTDATKLVVDVYATNSGFVNQIDVGVRCNGVAVTGNATGGVDLDVFNTLRAADCTLPGGTNKLVELIDGIQSYQTGTGDVLGVFPQYIRVPVSTPITPVIVSAPQRRLVVVQDSLATQGSDSSANLNSSTYLGWVYQARLRIAASVDPTWAGCQVSLEAWGSKAWSQIASSAPLRSAFVAQVGPMLDGTAAAHANRILFALGTNDYGLNTYASLATFEADVGALLDLLHATYPNVEVFLALPTRRLNETTNNGSTWNLVQLRTSLENVCASRPWIRLLRAQDWVSIQNRDTDGQQLHWEVAGHTEYEGNAGRALGYIGQAPTPRRIHPQDAPYGRRHQRMAA